jgi:hypothetical protein
MSGENRVFVVVLKGILDFQEEGVKRFEICHWICRIQLQAHAPLSFAWISNYRRKHHRTVFAGVDLLVEFLQSSEAKK